MAHPASEPSLLRAVAHPLRLAILEEMWDAGRPLRAKDLAEILGRPANSISYHVRTLRDAGYVVDADGPPGSTARDHWYAAPRRGAPLLHDSHSASAMSRTRYGQVADQSMAAQAAQEGPMIHVDGMIWLPKALAAQYVERLAQLASEMRRASETAQEEADPGASFVRYTFLTDLVPQMRGGAVLARPVEDLPQEEADLPDPAQEPEAP